ncbi:hypothetical protein I3760_05G180200 [Carya illinoinensis]|uniref:Uncharacterized protein n=1 Tax=Carya illinoinensis TaxID=32201 RepID=A0A8T1QJR0_CARIL|nr:uncharacterized protein LOC122311615 isoform X2 [Carya illinoinensis]KAG2708188.1 hypothetical protein I3760_05G180200 [Carya illinoinensis]KAG6654980.1 hypothetical protein CIPAW_05G183500 [Carya illinoinensis]
MASLHQRHRTMHLESSPSLSSPSTCDSLASLCPSPPSTRDSYICFTAHLLSNKSAFYAMEKTICTLWREVYKGLILALRTSSGFFHPYQMKGGGSTHCCLWPGPEEAKLIMHVRRIGA